MGGQRYWKDGRDVYDLIMGLLDYPETDSHPGFTLSLQCNFEDGGGGDTFFRFVGSDGVINVSFTQLTLNRTGIVQPSRQGRAQGLQLGHARSRSRCRPSSPRSSSSSPRTRSRRRARAGPRNTRSRRATTSGSTTSSTSSPRSARRSRSTRTRRSASAPRPRRCSATTACDSGG